MKGFALILFCLVTAIPVFSQNLVINADFEQVNICTEYSQPCSPVGWRTSSDIVMGYHPMAQMAHSGSYALPFLLYEPADTALCTYWQTALLCPLEKDSLYRLHFFLRSSPDHGPLLCMGIRFIRSWLYYPGSRKYFSNFYPAQPIREIKPGKKSEWSESELIYRAQGGESFMIMGNFLSVTEMEAKGVNLTRPIRYWIDDLSLEPVQGTVNELCNDCEQVKAVLLEDHNRHSRPPAFLPKTADFGSAIKTSLRADSLSILPLFFAFDSDKPDTAMQWELDRVINYIKSSPVDSIIIKGYADDRGSQSYNLDLSRRRAASVAAYLTQHFIPAYYIRLQSFGEQGTEGSSSTRHQNRRVELIIYRTVHPH